MNRTRLANTTRSRVAVLDVSVMALSLTAMAWSAETEARSTNAVERPITAEQRAHWAFQPVRKVAPPRVKQAAWTKTPIDFFVLAHLEKQGIKPAPSASKRELIRRVAFDVTGLPPTPEEIQNFLHDRSTRAYERMVDRYLDSPRYGEHWAQHWLDVVRFAETEGFEYDRDVPGLWRYRDYVIDSFNQDKPYDQFILEQIAGDELDAQRQDYLIAAGFHRLGPVRRNAGNQEVASSRNEVLTDRTDILGAAFLGLTMGCARCHDHKFDAIRQKDYYQLQAFVAATDELNIPLTTEEEQKTWKEKTDTITREVNKLKRALKTAEGEKRERLQMQVEELEDTLPPPLPGIATVRNLDEPTSIHVLQRGEWEKKGEPVGMRGPVVLVGATKPELPLATKNPRTELARWLADPNHPLTARVMVNRIWQQHFGQGLVKTANDFGRNGDRPSHPELLDYLASAFVENGWHIKPIHRLILLSSTYQQSSTSPAAGTATVRDAENRWLWRFNRRRLSGEEIRDAMLAASGRLNLKMGGASVLVPVDSELVAQLYKPSQWIVARDTKEFDRRSVYLLAKRNLRLPFMEVFDQPALQTSCGRREASTHAPQALELLNGQTANRLAEALAERLEREAQQSRATQVERAFWLVAGRAPTRSEKNLALEFLKQQPLREFALALFNLNAFLYVN